MEHFLDQVINGLQLGFMYALIALGYTMVYGIIKLINFAHGDVFMVGAFIGYYGFAKWGMPLPLAVITAMAVCAILGVVIEKIAYRPLRYAPTISVLISALGVSLFLEYFCSLRFVFGPNYRVVQRPFEEVHWVLGGVTFNNIQVMVAVVVIIMLLLLQYMIYRTKIGMAMRTVSFDHDAARLMGVNVDSVISVTFAIGSALAAAGGVLFAIAYPQIQPFMGIMPGLKAFTAAVLGGIGIVPGAVLGALIMGQVETLTAAYLPTQLRDAIAFAILIIVLMVRPTGILGKNKPEKV
ncbi:branched-chain amino acid ABC transporter permease [Pelotomaculum propionicicum]|uniref:High-affinity branched-chain amino acid transport system permease protein LivH n=1 Tax=Pelotomaculum propionicicum TaxID=258475 RepID=A0A4Y7RWF7_9FIRM|nr:branched-chain amino acid ABC transporter permease [Pelotomaculum propionicicum]NLI11231.1 branched-chain amino acid ABC transporter permease [Peptococcaceae bacterium]TEB13325.1 High-affinity branched-chain amino acid transport system permease protein LivH [Pelotomaculum propionicicum]